MEDTKGEGAVQEEFAIGNLECLPILRLTQAGEDYIRVLWSIPCLCLACKQICVCLHLKLQLTIQKRKQKKRGGGTPHTAKWQKHLLSGFSDKSSLCMMTDPLTTTI